MKITDDIVYIGVDDHDTDLFEGCFDIRDIGMAYNSYVILDDKIAVNDTVGGGFEDEWLGKLDTALAGRTPDYLIMHHMEPDHSSVIMQFLERYPGATVVASGIAFQMMDAYFGPGKIPNKLVVKQGSTLELGAHTLQFISAPQVHWPEVMFSYDEHDHVLFSADAFGTFGTLDSYGIWADDARRYYFSIVAAFGKQVISVLNKLEGFDVKAICSLHGPVLGEDIPKYLDAYRTWASYEPQMDGVTIAYTSIYGHNKQVVQELAQELESRGCPHVNVFDLARDNRVDVLASAFTYDRLVLATTTYYGDMYPIMRTFMEELSDRKFQNRTVAFVQNGTWAPTAAKKMQKFAEDWKGITFAKTSVSALGAPNDKTHAQIAALADELAK